jgi:nucleoside-diphosphate-sugar epimerase
MLRKPGNILFETGSHTISELLAVILDAPSISRVSARLPKVLPTGSKFYRRWSISAESGATAIEIDIAFDQGYGQHFIEVEGMFGVARADVENDVFTLDRPTGRTYDVERFFVNFNGGLSRIKQAFYTYGSYAMSKFLTSAKGSPYDASMLMGITNCYDELRGNATRRESSINYAISIAKSVEAIQAAMPVPIESEEKELAAIPRSLSSKNITPKVLIVGASGFIGKRLLTRLIEEDRPVRALVRNMSNLVGVDLGENSEIIVGDFRNDTTIEKALHGIDVVFHLAVAHSNSLQGYLRADSEPTLKFARMCEKHGVRRFIYTGTIDSLHLAKPGKIKETDGVDKHIKRRNNYAHSKAITESKLSQMYQESKFPVVIVRPAIVLGAGGPVNHVGIANWFGPGRCAYWGDGRNPLPIVLVDDVVSGLIAAIDAQGIEGKTYNLSAESCISARDYLSEVEKVLGSTITANSSRALFHFVGDFVKWSIKVLARHPDRSRIPSLLDWKCREQHADFDTSLARADLGWQPINDRETIIEKGIREPSRLFLNS